MRFFVLLLTSLVTVNTTLAQEAATTSQAQAPAVTTTTAPLAPPPDSDEVKTLKKIVVTGSYIRRTVDEGAPSPVTQIDANGKAAEASSQTAGGILKDNAVVSGAGANVSFHGQSSANNLVLLNGLRIPKPAGSDSASIDFIPSSAIERIEILKDGASALYGSEALAGVVNIITKKEYDGGNASIRYQRADMVNAPESTVTATYGKSFSSGNILGAFQFRNLQPIDYNETIYGMRDVPLQGSDASSPGNLKKNGGGTLHANDCPAGNLNGSSCKYNYYQNGLQYASEQDYYNGLITTGWDLGSKLRLESSVVYTHRKSEDLNTPITSRFENEVGGNNYSVTDGQATAAGWAPFLSGALTGGTYNVLYSPDEELGRRRDINTTDAGAVQMSLGQQFDNFDWDLAAGYSLSDGKTETVEGNANKSIMYAKLLDGSWNPFAPTGTKAGDLDAAKIQTWNANFADVVNTRLIGSGRMINWGDRSIYAAVGLEQQYQTYRFRADTYSLNNVALTGESSNQDGHRDVMSSFVELTQNPIHSLQVQLAGRFDKYSDFGSTINPKLGLAYKVTDEFTLRSSYGTGFKAPDLRSLYQGRLSSPRRFRDEVTCKPSSAPGGCNNLYSVTSVGDQNLDAEKGSHFNFGMQVRPKKNWQFSLDHWRARGENALNSVDLASVTEAEDQFGAGNLNSIGVTITRDPTTQIIQKVVVPVKTNSGTYDVNGIDLEVKYKNQFNPMGLGSVNFNFKFDHSHTLHNGAQPFVFDEYTVQRNLSWKNITSISLSKNNHLASWRMRTYSGGDFDTTRDGVGVGSTSTLTEHDLHYEYYGAWNGVITAGIRNVLNTLPVNTYSRGKNGMYLPAGETALGRTFYVGYSQDF